MKHEFEYKVHILKVVQFQINARLTLVSLLSCLCLFMQGLEWKEKR